MRARKPAPTDILSLLQEGDRRTIGRSNEVIATLSRNPKLFPQLIAGLWAQDAGVRMRAADVAEKVTRHRRELLRPYKKELIGLMRQTTQPELRWHLAVMLPRLSLNARQKRIVFASLIDYLNDRSSIVKTFAVQGLADLAESEPGLRPAVLEVLREAARKGTAAMKARSRKLLRIFEVSDGERR